jgi:hypothetical protein
MNRDNPVELIGINKYLINIPHNFPYVEYEAKDFTPRAVTRGIGVVTKIDTHRAKVWVFHEFRDGLRTEQRIALDKDAQKVVDMFVNDKARELNKLIDKAESELSAEKNKPLHRKVIDHIKMKLQRTTKVTI